MKGWIACAVLAGTVVVSGQTPAAKPAIANEGKPAISNEDDYSDAMKEVGALNATLRKSLAATPSETDAAAAAARLETIFKNVQAFWDHRKVEDATTAAKNAVAASQAISKAVAGHDMASATAASQALGATCMACHTAHRERLADAFYRIK